MRAVVWRGPDQLEAAEVPDLRPERGEVLLRVRDCGICGSDLHAAKLGLTLQPGCVLGHEFAGSIAELGEGVSGWEVGDRVVSLPFHACGSCDRCHAGEGVFCAGVRGIGLGDLPGAYAEYTRVVPQSLLRLPDPVSFRQGALVEPLAVGLHAVREGRVPRGGTVVIMGAGPIGLVTALWAKREGAGCVVVSEPSEGRRKLAARMGADSTVDPAREGPCDAARALSGREPDVIFECVGVPGMIDAAIQMAPLQARIVVAGVCMEPDTLLPVLGIMKEIEIKFVLAYRKGEFQDAIDALAKGSLPVDPMITDVIGLDGVPDAFRALATPTTQSKVLIEP
nr:putative zinc-dependent alcohol dehydrogenase [uncultured bacterium]